MKKILLVILLVFIVSGCFVYAIQSKQTVNKGVSDMDKKVLVAYFSATGTTKKVAQNLSKALNCDIYEIKPLQPYTSADLDWTNSKSRSSVEMKDRKSRPEMTSDEISIKDYDTIYLGFPIWWYVAPTIINTFLEKHDFSNKKIVLFATSGGSGFGKTIDNLKPSVSSSAVIVEGDILNNNPSVDELKKWAEKF
ncbi:MAG: NAD(P)H-dependent oxidoreductase [Candidatus Gastranaerophilales bacterium]|nr:NAD(P)H-dependent oxidoreductase [Candidatus Gastranaerophilales bacterium]